MSGRFVRASKFRHVFGQPAKKDKSYLNLTRMDISGEGNHVAANTQYFAVGIAGGGGTVLVHKLGNVGRLDLNAPKIQVHKAKVVDFEFSPFLNNVLATASEDCTVKVTAFPAEGLKDNITDATVTLEGHQKKLNVIRFSPTANNVLASCAFDNLVKVWDVEKGKEILNYDEFSDLPQSIEWNEDGSLIGAHGKDKTIRVFDPRTKGSSMKGPGFSGGKGARMFWMSALGRVGAVGFNNSRQYSIFDIKKMDQPLVTADIDQSAGVIIPYFDPDNSILYLAGKGDAGIKYFEAVAEEPYLHFLSEFRDNESQRGACFLPKVACDVKSCEIAVCLRVMKDWVCPISFQVPRKSDMFQADIFPDTYAGKPVVTADEWLAGTNKPPAKRSMKPGASVAQDNAAPAAAFAAAAKKPYEQIEKELAAAQARIAELEAQLAAKQ